MKVAVMGGGSSYTPELINGFLERTDTFPMTELWLLDVLKLNPGVRRLSEMNVDKACSYEKIQREMGWSPSMTLEQSIQDASEPAIRNDPKETE